MSDETVPQEPAETPAASRTSRFRAAAGRWRGRRVPLVAAGAVLVAGCLLGAGVTAVGAAIVGDDRGGASHGGGNDRGDAERRGDGRGGADRGRDHGRNRDGEENPAPFGSVAPNTPGSAVPAPSSS